MKIEKSKPFSNGMEYEFFKETWCECCTHCKYRDDVFPEFPEKGGCEVLDAMENARFDESKWPANEVIEERDEEGNIKYWHKCTKFMRRKKAEWNNHDND